MPAGMTYIKMADFKVRFNDKDDVGLTYIIDGSECDIRMFRNHVWEIVTDKVDSNDTPIGFLKRTVAHLNAPEQKAYDLECEHYYHMLVVHSLSKSYNHRNTPNA
jgi:hypothetical protein